MLSFQSIDWQQSRMHNHFGWVISRKEEFIRNGFLFEAEPGNNNNRRTREHWWRNLDRESTETMKSKEQEEEVGEGEKKLWNY